ncbi:hypothetical protein [Aliiroseovarius sp. YM-037]|uniref:hypothetical protein n=1 Tax=Aliiroseovarius sp. YM-037 TaxID=3341728 RepID=UPI003A801757
MEFRNGSDLYVLTNHEDGEYTESRIFSYNVETGDISPYFIFENWIKRFRILGDKKVYASQWDDALYMTSETEDEEHHFTIKCITAFDILDSGDVVLVGLDGKAARLTKEGKPSTIQTGLTGDILNCKAVGSEVYFCGAKGLFGKIQDLKKATKIELGTNRFLTALETNSDMSKLLVSGRGILLEIEDGELKEIARDIDFYESTEIEGVWYVTAGTDGLFRVVRDELERVSAIPGYCIAKTDGAIAIGGLDAFTILRDGVETTIKLDRNVLEKIHVY